jgi:tripartite-type tricarboxylate transporter receptor subunit TctC
MKDLPRRHFLRLAGLAAAGSVVSRPALAQAWPTRPVKLVVPFPAGGSTDLVGRIICQWLTERLGQSFIVENKPGAGSSIAPEAVVRSQPDGYTLLIITGANAINAALYDKLSYNLLRDILPVAGITRVPLVMEVNPSLPVNTVPEFISYAKANPGKINVASAGTGSMLHVAAELFKMMAGINMVHVPYRGTAPALTDLLGGQAQVFFDAMPSSIQYIREGKLRALAITADQRSESLPNIPTVAEFLPGYEASGWVGVGAPKGTPDDVIAKLNRKINAALADPKMKARLADLGGTTLAGSVAEFGKLIVSETEKWAKVVQFSGAKVN